MSSLWLKVIQQWWVWSDMFKSPSRGYWTKGTYLLAKIGPHYLLEMALIVQRTRSLIVLLILALFQNEYCASTSVNHNSQYQKLFLGGIPRILFEFVETTELNVLNVTKSCEQSLIQISESLQLGRHWAFKCKFVSLIPVLILSWFFSLITVICLIHCQFDLIVSYWWFNDRVRKIQKKQVQRNEKSNSFQFNETAQKLLRTSWAKVWISFSVCILIIYF